MWYKDTSSWFLCDLRMCLAGVWCDMTGFLQQKSAMRVFWRACSAVYILCKPDWLKCGTGNLFVDGVPPERPEWKAWCELRDSAAQHLSPDCMKPVAFVLSRVRKLFTPSEQTLTMTWSVGMMCPWLMQCCMRHHACMACQAVPSA